MIHQAKKHIQKRLLAVILLAAVMLSAGCGKTGNAAGADFSETSASSAAGGNSPEAGVSSEAQAASRARASSAEDAAHDGADDAERTQHAAESGSGNSLKAEPAEPDDDNLVRVRDFIPDVLVDLKYAADDNFTGEAIYDFSDAYLRYGTVKRLREVQAEMETRGLTLKIWDAFRPIWAQQVLWDVYPDPTYVSDPDNGYTSHNFGNTVDITVVRRDGTEIEMPTGFDDFSEKADRDYSDCTDAETEHVLLLENAMESAGFTGYYGEWWHYEDIDEYPGEDLQSAVLS